MAIPKTFMGFQVAVAEVLVNGSALDVAFLEHGTDALTDRDDEIIGVYTSSGDDIWELLQGCLNSGGIPMEVVVRQNLQEELQRKYGKGVLGSAGGAA
jgi:hypothetical protein